MGLFRHKNRKKADKTPAKPPELPVICDDIEKISFAAFLKCAVQNDLSPLIVSGQPSERSLFLAWITVLSKHYELIGSKEAMKHVQLVCKLERLNVRIHVISSVCEALRINYKQEWGDILRAWGIKRPFTPETLESDLVYAGNELQSNNHALELAMNDFKRKEKDNQKAGKSTKETYMRTLYAVEAYINRNGGNRQLDPETTSLYKFDILYNELVQYNEALKRAHGTI